MEAHTTLTMGIASYGQKIVVVSYSEAFDSLLSKTKRTLSVQFFSIYLLE